MRITVKLFATLTRYTEGLFSGTPFEVELADGASLADLLERLKVPAEEVKITFVNGIIQPPEFILHAGDEVGIFPPIAGG